MSSDSRSGGLASFLDAADLRGLSRLGIEGVVGVADLVEAMHAAIGSHAGLVGPARRVRTRGVTGLVYRAVRGTTRGIGQGLDALLSLVPLSAGRVKPRREAFIAALNGVWGDHLAATANPLAIAMSLRVGGRPHAEARNALETPSGRLVVLVHGLAMNDLQWSRHGHDHGAALARDLGFTPLYLHYNSGRHVADNGRDFGLLLASLVATWPVPVQELVIVGHSMGGLVARSACYAGVGEPWMSALTRLVCLGTPHHGAPLERGGGRLDAFLALSPYVAPLARLSRTRSAGIADLRFGNVRPPASAAQDRHAQSADDRPPTPLPSGVETFFVAATTGATLKGLRSRALGDGLVPLASALGEHPDPAHDLQVPARRRKVVTSAHHFDLLDRQDVYLQLRDWLSAPPSAQGRRARIAR